MVHGRYPGALKEWRTRQDSNLEPSDPKSDTLSIELRVRCENRIIKITKVRTSRKEMWASSLLLLFVT